ncbi:MAG: hypothetical protein M1831_000145 [Alyxoria varia]|nr:MAG: hypothetical protein M1831_000145 [Alyxoria varia]
MQTLLFKIVVIFAAIAAGQGECDARHAGPRRTNAIDTTLVERDADPGLLDLVKNVLDVPKTVMNQVFQNGGGIWGLGGLDLPLFRKDGGTPTPNGWPWGKITTTNANPYTSAPDTSMDRKYNFRLSRCTIAPDGVQGSALCINGQFPGPLIEANYGDVISVTVTNDLKDEGTSIHWHGLLQTWTNYEDGVASVTQCPIAPGSSFTYRFQATLYGSTWYHAHYSAQYAAGAVGPMVIHGPNQVDYDVDLGPVMLQDWYHSDYNSLLAKMLNPLKLGGPAPPLAASNLINGKNSYNCSKAQGKKCTPDAPLSYFDFKPGKSHRLRIINMGSGAIQKFTIDGHKMRVMANDFVPVKSYTVDMLSLGVGQRADVIVEGNGKKGELYWMRSTIEGCSLNDGLATQALAAVAYTGADKSVSPKSVVAKGAFTDNSPGTCANDPLSTTEPVYPISVQGGASVTRDMKIEAKSNGTHIVYLINGKSFRGDYNKPLLAAVHSSRDLSGIPPERNLWDFGTNSSVRIVIYNHHNQPHPMHLHGHNMHILASGFGKWDGSIVRASNPQRRDVQVMPPGSEDRPSYLVVQWKQDNPGVWPLHCVS